MTATTLRYFAYGSNMLSRRLHARVPSAKGRGIGRLCGYRLMWHKRSRDGSGKCDVVATSNQADVVWGVVFEILAGEKPVLDLAEGLGSGYAEKAVEVTMASINVAASLYFATSTDPSLRPYDWYKAFVVAGGREHGLPPEYIAALEAGQAKADDDLERRAANEALLPTAPSESAVLDDPLKPLAEVNFADSRQVHFVGTLADQHGELAAMVLNPCVPKTVRQLYETAKNVSLYSYFVYRFHQVAESVAFQALEMALSSRFKADETEASSDRIHC